MTQKMLMTALKVLGVIVLLLGGFYIFDRYFVDRSEQQKIEAIQQQFIAVNRNMAALIARSDIPGYWIYIIDREPAMLKGEKYEIDRATVGEIIFNTEKSKADIVATYKDYFSKNGWKIGTDDFKLGKLSFSKDQIGQLVFVTVGSDSQLSHVTLKRIVAHE